MAGTATLDAATHRHATAPAGTPVRTAAPDEEDQLLATLTLAFATDPMVRWGFPEPRRFLAAYPALARAFGGAAFAHGTAHRTDGYAGAALWLPPGVHPDEEAIIGVLRQNVPAERQADVFGVLERMSAFRPGEPHWYLPFIGVEPARQRLGLGAAMLRHALARCDAEEAVAYLESSNPENIPLYERHGFHLLGTIQVGATPPMFPMLRKPRR